MANKRDLKKNLNEFIFDVVDELFDRGMQNDTKYEASEVLIDEAALFRNQMLGVISKANSKKDFKEVVKTIEEKVDYFVEKLNKL